MYLQGNISESLIELKHLEYLDLSGNSFVGISIPKFLGFMSSLRFLNLSSAEFGGKIPSSIGNLTSLDTLDLSFNFLVGEIPRQLGNLSNLQYLSVGSIFNLYNIDKFDWVSRLSHLKLLDFNNLNISDASDWVESFGKLPSLQVLHLSYCQLTQIPPISNVSFSSLSVLDLSGNIIYSIANTMASLQNLTSLRKLDLSNNWFSSFLPNNLFGDFTQLELLNLGRNGMKGQIPSSIGNLTSLNTLDLSMNDFVGQIPTSFKSFCNLRWLSLSRTQMSQEVNELIKIFSDCASQKLESLDLSHCQFSGYLSNHLMNFTSLVLLDISNNSIAAPVPVSFGEMTSLTFLDLSFNKLNGSLPLSFGRLENLKHLYVSHNSLEGEVSEIHFKNLHKLLEFDANENHLIWKVNPDWIPPFQLVVILSLGSCEVGPQFPNWLRHLKYLEKLDLSNSNINSPLPNWVLNFSSSLDDLNLSQNNMYGMIPNLSIEYVFVIFDLSSNNFHGPLPYIDTRPFWIDLSNNLLSGSIHNLLCNRNLSMISITSMLSLEENHLNGEIPNKCWENWKDLNIVELSHNNFGGNIPTSIGSLRDLQLLSLRDNSLSGEIPSTLQNCTGLVVLDLGENELTGEIPKWIGERLGELIILNIRGNKFRSHMPKELCSLTKLQILDFANNKINGTIPTCVGNLTGMSQTIFPDAGSIYVAAGMLYIESSTIFRKGRMVEYKTTLGFVQSFDLSNNSFVGEIPQGITNLSGLQSLNLSFNFLTGRIPTHINGLQKLESLDLSQNHIFGKIPQSLSSMTFLSSLNLSHNNLSGRIPTGTQLQGMDPSSFAGNELCGPPLTKDCNNKEETPPSNKEKREDHVSETGAVDWFYFYVSLAPGFVVGFWGVVGPLAFNIRWRRAYYNFLDLLWDKFLVWFHLNIVRSVRNYGS